MVEPTIKAKLVLDTQGMKGAAAGMGGGGKESLGSGLRSALEGLDFPVLGDIGAALSGLLLAMEAVRRVITGVFRFLKQSSPLLARSVDLLRKGLEILLRPIGDILGLFLKPFAIAMLKFAIPIYKKWREFLEQPETQAGIEKINQGAGKVGEGILALDFSKVKEGLMDIFGGVQEIAGGFFSFLGGELDGLWPKIKQFGSDAWEFLKESFGSVSEWINEKIQGGTSTGLKFAWEWFQEYLSALGEDWWMGPLAPFAAAVQATWATVVEPMVDALITALDDKIPGLKEALSFLFTSDEEGENKGFFKSWIEQAKEWDNIVMTTINPGLGVLYTTAEAMLGKNTKEKKNSVLGSINKTIDGFTNQVSAIDILVSSLLGIPTTIVTTHIIKTVYETEGDE